MENLIDLIIYSLDDGENVDKFSAEHITGISMDEEFLTVSSSQRGVKKYIRSKVGFFLQGR